MSHLKNANDPILFLYKKFSSLEFKEKETISSLIKNYYPLNKDEEIYIKDISLLNKNEFINQIKKIFHELSISMETIEYIFNEYYHFINKNDNENPFFPLQKSEVVNKLGINSNIYNKISSLYYNIIFNLRDEKPEISQENFNNVDGGDVEMIDENEKNKKRNIGLKIDNINSLCKDVDEIFTTYYQNKKKVNNQENNEPKKNKNTIGNIILTPEEEEKLKKNLEFYKSVN